MWVNNKYVNQKGKIVYYIIFKSCFNSAVDYTYTTVFVFYAYLKYTYIALPIYKNILDGTVGTCHFVLHHRLIYVCLEFAYTRS